MATNMQDYSPINSLQKMVDTIPNGNVSSSGSEKKKAQKNKKKENMPPPSTLPQLQTTPAFAPNELLKEMGFDISSTTFTSSYSTVSPTTVTIMDEKYDLNICLFHLCNLELFQAMSNME